MACFKLGVALGRLLQEGALSLHRFHGVLLHVGEAARFVSRWLIVTYAEVCFVDIDRADSATAI